MLHLWYEVAEEGPPLPMNERRPRRARNPEQTREDILAAAREVLAQDGKEGLSVARVAQRAGINRGTAYQHFQTREQLIDATVAWVSRKLYEAVFGDPDAKDAPTGRINVEDVNEHIASFAMENPALGRVWLLEVLSSRQPAKDLFWQKYKSNFELFAQTSLAQPDMDAEVLSVLTLAGSFIWPVWARAHARSAKDRKRMLERFTNEMLRHSLHGVLRPEKYKELDAKVTKALRKKSVE
jgi:AcrR family transcriptional regulator